MTDPYVAEPSRYDTMPYRRTGRSGLLLPAISLGLWQNFGATSPAATQREIVRHAFDRGVTHFDLANNYGPPPGSAEESFGRMLATDLRPYRDEIVVSTKAGYWMHPGPYGEWGSRKYLLSSLDASLRRMGLDHVDIFYSHRFDPDTPLAETLGALKSAVDSGKALYAGLSSYSASRTLEAVEIAERIGLPLLLHQPSYSMLNRWVEQPDERAGGKNLLEVLEEVGMGMIAFSPLAQGLLTKRYLDGVPTDSRAARKGPLHKSHLSEENLTRIRALAVIAEAREQSLAQLALAWALRDERVTSLLLGASSVAQLDENLAALERLELSDDELVAIEEHAVDGGINLWEPSSRA